MNKIFVDTSGWGNLVDALQEFHSETKTIYLNAKQNGSRLVTTNYIIAELVALLSSPMRIPRMKSVKFIESIKSSALVDIVHIDEDLDAKSWELLKNRADKNWSLVDCSSFVVMEENKIVEALTTDHHFEQAGFVRLLK
ncbi:MAG: type II toxin-antitoxin system VapC family toxin [Acidobacteria bacterium]|nr:type II toxin-antitoxin system VapC family toxin [Acidobacteriota bacterium]